MCLNCDHPECEVHQKVEDGLAIMSQFSGAIAAVKEDYKDTKEAQGKIHDALLEQTMTLKHVNKTMEQDRLDRKELYGKAEDARVALEGKADKDTVNEQLDKKISRTSVGIVTGIIIVIFVVMTFMKSVG